LPVLAVSVGDVYVTDKMTAVYALFVKNAYIPSVKHTAQSGVTIIFGKRMEPLV
jgi:hypothetical protein